MEAQCPTCGLQIESDSIFCRHCGHRLKTVSAQDEADASRLVALTTNWVKGGIDELLPCMRACVEYVKRFPEGPAYADMSVTGCVALTTAAMNNLVGDPWYDGTSRAAGVVARGVPEVLKNGLITVPRISDKEKQKEFFGTTSVIQQVFAELLGRLFVQAEQEAASLLVDGQPRFAVTNITYQDAYRDAEIYYKAYTDGDMEGALRGFTHLKSLNPADPYFRNIIGSILSQQGKTQEALREFLYGSYLEPCGPDLTANLLRELTALGLHPSAAEVWAHYRRYRAPKIDSDRDRMAERFGRLATICTAAWVCHISKLSEADLSREASDISDDIPSQERPWLVVPKPIVTPSESTLDGKRVFVSYRHLDSSPILQRFIGTLKISYPSVEVFLDTSKLVTGERFTEQLREAITKTDVFVLLIGAYWRSAEGLARLNETDDIVRREVAWAIRKGVPMVPVLLEDVHMPRPDELPEILRPIVELHAQRLRTTYLEGDMRLLQISMAQAAEKKDSMKSALEQSLKELDELERTDPGALAERIGAMVKDAAGTFPYYRSAKSARGEGVPSNLKSIYGTWECLAVGRERRFSVRFVIEDREGNLFDGELTTLDASNRAIEAQKLRGEWAAVLDMDADLMLGLDLDCTNDTGRSGTLRIPFHRKVGDRFIGTDAEGVEYTSQNIKPRVDGF